MADSYDSVLSKGLDSELQSTPLEAGKLRFTIDTRRIFLDEETERIEFTDFIKDMTEAEITATLAPLPKFYFSSDTHRLLYYVNGEWLVVAEKNAEEEFTLSKNDDGTLSLTYNGE